ncbi:MAG: hypothetical protein KC438_09410 [Thermomicrobiales bacterium]|nr:hypothetical protein [Thermomicrobiales bacterium]
MSSPQNPVKKIREESHDAAVDTDLSAALLTFAQLPPSTETPYATVTLDWYPEGGKRTSPTEAWGEIKEEVWGFHFRSAEGISAENDRLRIGTYIADELDKTARGAMIVSNSGEGAFEAASFGLSIPTTVHLGPIPYLKEFTRLVEDNPTHAMLVLDQDSADLYVINADVLTESVSVTGTKFPRHQASGGLNQRRYQNRANERIETFIKSVAEEVQKVLDDGGIRRLVVGSDEVNGALFQEAAHDTLKEKIIGAFRVDISAANFDKILELAEPIATAYERTRESDAVDAVADAIGSGNRGAAGAVDILKALEQGQVYRLVMSGDYAEMGWADYTMPIYGVGEIPAEHPAGGDPHNIVPVPLEQEMIRQALLTGAQIEIVDPSVSVSTEGEVPKADGEIPNSAADAKLDALGGVGALLRW